MDSLFLGAMLSISSTTVIIKVLNEMGRTKETFAQLIFGILIIEDILGIAMIALLSGIAMTGTFERRRRRVTLGKLGIFLVVVLVVGLIAVPRLLGYVAEFKSNEMLLDHCAGILLRRFACWRRNSVTAWRSARLSSARSLRRRGRFIGSKLDRAGARHVQRGVLRRDRVADRSENADDPLGAGRGHHRWPWLSCKVIACASGTFLGGYDRGTSLRVGMGVAQIGEFSFIIASLGVTLKVTSDFLYPIAVAVSAHHYVADTLLDQKFGWGGEPVRPFRPGSVGQLPCLSIRNGSGNSEMKRHPNLAAKLTRGWILQMALNVALMTGIFIAAVYFGQHPPVWLRNLGLSGESLKTGALVRRGNFLAAVVHRHITQAPGAGIADRGNASDESRGGRTHCRHSSHHCTGDFHCRHSFLGFYVLVLTSTLLPIVAEY